MYCLDTNAVIAILKGQPQVVERFRVAAKRQAAALPVIALFELWYGVARSGRPAENKARLDLFLQGPVPVWSFEAEDAEEAGDIRAALARTGQPIGPYDILIAAQARRRGATLVTANRREFARVPDLPIEDWAA